MSATRFMSQRYDRPSQPSTGADSRSFRDVMGRFPTGVVLVTASTPDGPVGLAVNSFTSVSLEPPLISFCAANASKSWKVMREVGTFAVVTLGAHHESLSRHFARSSNDKFSEHIWGTTPSGHPTVPDAIAWMDAEIEWTRTAGDHELVVARAVAWEKREHAEPLVFADGRYRRLRDISRREL